MAEQYVMHGCACRKGAARSSVITRSGTRRGMGPEIGPMVDIAEQRAQLR